MFDTHTHCDFSTDSHMKLPEAMAAAVKAGIGLIVTEHWDYEYPDPTQFVFDRDEYFRRDGSSRSEQVLLGIEVGMQPHLAAKENLVPEGYPFDYVIGSLHFVHKSDMYNQTTYQGLTKSQVEEAFLADALACVRSHDNFDSFGHIDYICRYWPYQDKNLYLADHKEIYAQIFETLIAKEKPLEINTRRFEDASVLPPLLELYKFYQELGGKYCTLGSDSHYPEHVGRNLKLAAQLAEACKLTPVYFKGRRMYQDKI